MENIKPQLEGYYDPKNEEHAIKVRNLINKANNSPEDKKEQLTQEASEISDDLALYLNNTSRETFSWELFEVPYSFIENISVENIYKYVMDKKN